MRRTIRIPDDDDEDEWQATLNNNNNNNNNNREEKKDETHEKHSATNTKGEKDTGGNKNGKGNGNARSGNKRSGRSKRSQEKENENENEEEKEKDDHETGTKRHRIKIKIPEDEDDTETRWHDVTATTHMCQMCLENKPTQSCSEQQHHVCQGCLVLWLQDQTITADVASCRKVCASKTCTGTFTTVDMSDAWKAQHAEAVLRKDISLFRFCV